MLSLHKALAECPKTEAPAEFEASKKKRKWEETLTGEFFKHQTDAEKRKPIFDIELHLKTPLPSDKWQQQYLSVQSGQIHLCNTRMTPSDSKRDPEPEQPSLGQISLNLDLELNLTCESLRKKEEHSYDTSEKKKRKNSGSPGSSAERDLLIESSNHKRDSCDLKLSSDGDYKEMIATVCMKCHMLVMLCKSSPSCPNCKFMHPPDQNPSKFLMKGRRFSLLC